MQFAAELIEPKPFTIELKEGERAILQIVAPSFGDAKNRTKAKVRIVGKDAAGNTKSRFVCEVPSRRAARDSAKMAVKRAAIMTALKQVNAKGLLLIDGPNRDEMVELFEAKR